MSSHLKKVDLTCYPMGTLTVNWASDGGPWATHNMPCPVCMDNPAVIVFVGESYFEPCHSCNKKGFRITRKPTFLEWFRWRNPNE